MSLSISLHMGLWRVWTQTSRLCECFYTHTVAPLHLHRDSLFFFFFLFVLFVLTIYHIQQQLQPAFLWSIFFLSLSFLSIQGLKPWCLLLPLCDSALSEASSSLWISIVSPFFPLALRSSRLSAVGSSFLVLGAISNRSLWRCDLSHFFLSVSFSLYISLYSVHTWLCRDTCKYPYAPVRLVQLPARSTACL